MHENIIPDEGVDAGGIDSVEALDGSLNLGLVGTDVANEDQSIVLFNLAHSALSVQGEADDGVGVHLVAALGNSCASILGSARQSQGLGAAEGSASADLAGNLSLTLEGSLLGRLGLVDGSAGA